MAAEAKNQKWVLVRNPDGAVKESDFRLEEAPAPAAPKEGEIVVESLFVSVDPYLRARLTTSYKPGQSVESGTVARVLAVGKGVDGVAKGATVVGIVPWARRATINAKTAGVRVLDPKLLPRLSLAVGALGMPGATAFFGLLDVAELQKAIDAGVANKKTVLVTGAAGAVGSVVGQLAKHHGLRVVGVAGTPAKCKYLKDELGFDAVINYREVGDDYDKALAELTRALDGRAGFDYFFENTGGTISEAAFSLMSHRGRIALCGGISAYNKIGTKEVPMMRNTLLNMIYKEVRLEGFIVTTFFGQFDRFLRACAPLVASGKIKARETVLEGFDKIPTALVGLFTGANTGKMVVKI